MDKNTEEQLVKEFRYVLESLKEMQESVETTDRTLQTIFSVESFQTEVLTQLLRNSELTVCLLEQISKQTCQSLNEAHFQTDLQKSIRDSLATLLELYKTEHPGAALEFERLRELSKLSEACCPPEQPKLMCEPQPCTPGPIFNEGSAQSSTVAIAPNKSSDGPFPPHDISCEESEGNLDQVHELPIGPLRGSFSPTVQRSTLLKITSDPESAHDLGAAGDPVIFNKDTPFGSKVTAANSPPDMSGAMHDNVVLMSGNTYVMLSTDSGNTFTYLNPTTIFKNSGLPTRDATGNLLDNGLCCDQVIQYAPQIDRFIWLMQFCGTGANCLQGVNKIRIASASPADIVKFSGDYRAWTYWDITSALLNLGNTTMDYPDMSIGTNFLYVSADQVGVGLLVLRIPLSEIQNSGTINFNFTNPSNYPNDRGSITGVKGEHMVGI